MTDFIEKIKAKVDEGISSISSISKEKMELVRLRNQLRQLEKEKEQKIRSLGMLVSDMLRKDDYNEQKIRDFYSNMPTIDRQIINVENEIKKIQEISGHDIGNIIATCECGTSLTERQKFCASCGKDVTEVTMPRNAIQTMKSCTACGAQVKEAVKFCGKCGVKQG